MRIPFGFQSHDIPPASRQRNVNCHIVQNPQGAKSPLSLTRAPGIEEWSNLGTVPTPTNPGAASAWCVHNGVPFVVSGGTLLSLAADGFPTVIGVVGEATDMASSGSQLMIVGQIGYIYDGFALNQITDLSYTNWDWVEWIDGYFVGGRLGLDTFYWSALGNGLVYDSLDSATAESHPDGITDVLVDHREIVFAGPDSVELWYNAGGPAQFTRIPNGTIELGCVGQTLAALENSFYWLASDYTVRRLDGLTPVRVSTDAVERALYGVLDATGFGWRCGGRQYYAVRTDNQCWTLDLYTGLWHERESYGKPTWRTKGSFHAYGKDMAVDSDEAAVGVFSNSAARDYNAFLRWYAVSGTIYNEGRRMFHGKLTLEFDKGKGGLNDEAQVMFRFSNDDGNTWSTQLVRGLGKEGEYKDRVIFNRLGSSRSRIYEFVVSNPYPVTLTDAFADVR